MKFTKMLFLILGFLALSSCAVNPEADLIIKSISQHTEGSEKITVTLEERDGFDVYINGYYVEYYEMKSGEYIEGEDYDAPFNDYISGASHSDAIWESSTKSISVPVVRSELTTYAEDNSLEEIRAFIYFYGEDENGNDIRTNKKDFILNFPAEAETET